MCLSTVALFFYEFHCQKNIGMLYNVVNLFTGTIFTYSSIKTDFSEKVQLIGVLVNVVVVFSALFYFVTRQFVFESKDSFTFVPTLYFALGAVFISLLGTYILYTQYFCTYADVQNDITQEGMTSVATAINSGISVLS